MERFFNDPSTPQRFRLGPLGSHIDQLANDLSDLGYARSTIRYHLRIVDHFGRWLEKRKRSIQDITDDDVRRYVDQRGRVRNGDASALTLIVDHLRERGLVKKRPAAALTPAERVIADYRRYASNFLVGRFGNERVDLRQLSAADVLSFVQTQAAAAGSDAIKNVTNALRSFLIYARCRGLISLDLAAAVPGVANWWFSTVPKALPRADVVRALQSCDRRTNLGRRD